MRGDIHSRDERIRFLETCAMEWDAVFGPKSLTPSQLQSKLDSLNATVAELKRTLDVRQARHESEIAELERAMTEHYAAARDDHRAEMARITSRHSQLATQLMEEHGERLSSAAEAWKDKMDAALAAQASSHQEALDEAREKATFAEAELEASKEEQNRIMLEDYEKYEQAIDNELRIARERHEDEISDLEETLRTWESQRAAAEAHAQHVHAQELAAVKEAFEKQSADTRTRANQMEVENAYLRKRVKDLNRLLRAFKNAVE